MWVQFNEGKKLRPYMAIPIIFLILSFFIIDVTVDNKIIVIHYSDAHIGEFQYIDSLGRNSLERYQLLIEALNNLNFDFAVDTGDSINGANSGNPEVWDLFERLKSKIMYRVFYTMGNHDWSSSYGRERWLNSTKQKMIDKIDVFDIRFVFFSPEEWRNTGSSDPLLSERDKMVLKEYLNTDKQVFLFTHANLDYWNAPEYAEDIASKITFTAHGHDHNYAKPTQKEGYIALSVPSIRTGSFETHDEILFNKYTISKDYIRVETINAETLETYYSNDFKF